MTEAASQKLAPIRIALSRLKLFIVFGWLTYPLGFLITLLFNSPDMRVARELVYNFAQLLNKIGLGIVAIFAIQQMMREEKIREAMLNP